MRKRIIVLFPIIYLFIFAKTCFAELSLTMLNIGQAESMILQCDGHTMIIDTGYAHTWNILRDALVERNINTIDFLVLTHPHADHIGAAPQLINTYPISHALLPPIEYSTQTYENVMNTLYSQNVQITYPIVGDTFSFGSAEITIYGPHPVAYAEENNWSLVLMIHYAGRSILLTADIEAEAEADLLANSDLYPLHADILKVAHHGSATSTTYAFARSVSPQYALISCASDESSPYPHLDTIMTLIECGTEYLYTTSLHGNINILIAPQGHIHLTE